MKTLLVCLIGIQTLVTTHASDCGNLRITSEWETGYDGFLIFELDHSTSGWEITLSFDKKVNKLECWQGVVSTTDGQTFSITNVDWNPDYDEGKHMELHYQPQFEKFDRPYLVYADMDGQNICDQPHPTQPTTQTTTRKTTPTTTRRTTPTTTTHHDTTTPMPGPCDKIINIGPEDGPQQKVEINLTPSTDIESWTVELNLEYDVSAVTSPLANVKGSGKKWTLTSMSWDGNLPADETFVLALYVFHGGKGLPLITNIIFNDESICDAYTTPNPTPKPTPKPTPSPNGGCDDVVSDVVDNGSNTDLIVLLKPDTSVENWEVKITLGSPIQLVATPLADVTGSGKLWTLKSKSWDGNIPAGETFKLSLNFVHGSAGQPSIEDITFNEASICEGSVTTIKPNIDCDSIMDVSSNGDNTDLTINVTPKSDLKQWKVKVIFKAAVKSITSPLADINGSGKSWTLSNKSWDGSIPAGETLPLNMNIKHDSNIQPDVEDILLNEDSICEGPETTTSITTTTESSEIVPDHPAKYNYAEVIEKSLLFYEAQRSGRLPKNNRVPWRGNSGMSDEVVGGYYDAGDHVKFGFPMAGFTTILAWGGINFKDGYEKAGQMDYLIDCLKWSTDYFIGCHKKDFEFIGQIGDGYADHAYWGRPEEMTMSRPAFRITANKPGSELAGETAAALASSSIVFRENGDTAYADKCLEHAKKLFEFADKYRGRYTNAIPAGDFYNNFGGYDDELAWAAAWIAMATRDSKDIAKAEDMYDEVSMSYHVPAEVSWDEKSAMVFLVMYELTGKSEYRDKAEEFVETIQSSSRTNKGMVWISSSQWGSLRYAANFAMFAVQAVHSGIQPKAMFDFAEGQINYILGDTGRSYVVGFGKNPPQKAHHRAASCPNRPAPCDWSNKDNPGPNPQIIYGALVGGPDFNDNYVDDRNNFQMTEVTDDYNAGFQTAVAALNSFFK